MREIFRRKAVDNNACGLNVWSVVGVGVGGTPVVITDDSETLWLYYLKSVVVGEHVELETGEA